MLALASDENLHDAIVRGLLRREPNVDIVRIRDTHIAGASDVEVLAWAAEQGRVVVTHDRGTMSAAAKERISAGLLMPGLVIVNQRATIAGAIDDLLLIAIASERNEFENSVIHIPW